MFDPIIQFRKRLAAGDILLGPGINLTDLQASDALAESSDFFWFDLEHQAMSCEALRNHLILARAKNTPGIVRVPDSSHQAMQSILDAGAHGIIVPQVRSVEQVQQIVAACRYPPAGQRGFWPMIPTNYCRDDVPPYLEQANANLFVSVMIETIEAVDAIDEIVAVNGLDSIVLGLMDLSGSFGLLGQVDHPKVVTSMEKVIASAKAVGIPVGCGQGTDAERIRGLARRGIQWFQTGMDCQYLVEFLDQLAARVRDGLEQPEWSSRPA